MSAEFRPRPLSVLSTHWDQPHWDDDMAAGSFALPSWSREELEVLSELQEGHLFIDETFAPNSHALGRDSDKSLAISWARMHEALPGAALFVGGAPPGDLVAGPNVAGNGIDDAWFAGALATVATRADLLLRLFASVDNEESGMLSLRFFKHGAWRTVLVDTMLPCVTSGPAFCHGASGLELWPSVLLKAYAKMHGGYAKLHGGDAGDALVDLTGGALTREVMPQLSRLDEDEEREAKLAQVWGLVRETEHGGGLLALEAARGGNAGGGSIAEDGGAGGGLMAGRLYPLLETYEDVEEGTRLLRLRNPWGGDGWHGAWSEGSEELAQMQAQLALTLSLTPTPTRRSWRATTTAAAAPSGSHWRMRRWPLGACSRCASSARAGRRSAARGRGTPTRQARRLMARPHIVAQPQIIAQPRPHSSASAS